jgi:hypothetical protein
VNWDLVLALAARHHATRFVLQGAWLAREELGRPLPYLLTSRLARDRTAVAAARLARRSWSQSAALSYASYALAMGDLRSRATAVREVFIDPTPLDCEVVDLPRPLFSLYYGVRPVRLVFKHVLRKHGRPWGV